jgi:hypothetical protein
MTEQFKIAKDMIPKHTHAVYSIRACRFYVKKVKNFINRELR